MGSGRSLLGGVSQLSWAELRVQQVQKLELQSPISRMTF